MQSDGGRKKSIILSYVTNILSIIINIFWGPFLIRMLGEAEYGIYQMVASFAGYLVLMNFGTGTVMTRYVSLYRNKGNKEEESNFIATCLWITVGLVLLIVIVSIILYSLLPSLYNKLTAEQLLQAKILFVLVVFNIIITLIYQAYDGIILAYEYYQITPMWNLIKLLVRTMAIASCIIIIPNSIFICIVDVMLSFIYLLFTVIFVKKHLKIEYKLRFFDRKLIIEITSFSLAIFLQAFVNQVNSNVDKTLLGAMLSPESVSIYTLAMSISTIFSTLSTVMLGFYLPQFTKMVSERLTTKQMIGVAVAPCRFQFLMSGIILFGFIICGKDFVVIWAGEKYMEVWDIAIILMIPMFFVYINGIVVSILDAMKKRLFRSIVLSLGAVFNILISVVLINNIGIMGAPIGTAIATLLFSVIIMNLYYQKKLKLPIIYLLKETCVGLLPCLLIALIITLPFCALISYSVYGLMIKGGIFVISLVVLLLKFGLNNEEKLLFKEIKNKVLKR